MDKQIARAAAMALGLHASATPEMAAHSLQWRGAKECVERAQLRLLWELTHKAPRKARRVHHELVHSTAVEGGSQAGPNAIDGALALWLRTDTLYDVPAAKPVTTTGKFRVVTSAKGRFTSVLKSCT